MNSKRTIIVRAEDGTVLLLHHKANQLGTPMRYRGSCQGGLSARTDLSLCCQDLRRSHRTRLERDGGKITELPPCRSRKSRNKTTSGLDCFLCRHDF
jgi:hypothetical protein